MGKQKIFWVLLISALTCNLFGAADPNTWGKLNLASIEVAGTTVYYEKSLEVKLRVFEQAYKQYLAERSKYKSIVANRKKIVNDIKKILGISDAEMGDVKKIFEQFCSILTIDPKRFCLIKETTIRDLLRSGGELPGFTYDEGTDKIVYKTEFMGGPDMPAWQWEEFIIPVFSDEEFAKDVNSILQRLGPSRAFLFVHELVEVLIVTKRLRPQYPHWRWFSDGCANAITFEILKKYAGPEVAAEFVADFDVNQYRDIEKEINLMYWMGAGYCIETPLGYEKRLQEARYAYSMYETKRIIESYGIDSVCRILDEFCSRQSKTSRDFFQAIEAVTGEDIEKRLRRYQTFEASEQGLAKYNSRYSAAKAENDAEGKVTSLLRYVELLDSQYSNISLLMRVRISWELAEIGYEKSGYEALHKCIQLLSRGGMPYARERAMEAFVIYALQANKPCKAKTIADAILKRYPEHMPSLTVCMKCWVDSGQLGKAKTLAKKIMDLEKDQNSPAYKTALEVLATDPNQQHLDKQLQP